MKKKKIFYLMHTEYHLLLSIFHAMENNYLNGKNDVHLIIKSKKSNRLGKDINFDFLPVNVHYINRNIKLKLKENDKEKIDTLINIKVDEFNFFQEQDPLALIFIEKFRKQNTEINLFQDGLKAYAFDSLGFTPSLHLTDLKINKWILQNGYKINDWLSIFKCNKYAFIKGIDKLFVSRPDKFVNRKNLPVEGIRLSFTKEYSKIIKHIFQWKDDILPERENVIFFMNQPMHDDGSFDMYILNTLREKYPEKTIYIKNHPLTPQSKLRNYKSLEDVKIIKSKIPAELFISMLSKSIVLSVASTSMLTNNPSCKFYWLHGIKKNNNIETLKKYKIYNPTDHIQTIQDVNDIKF